MVAEADELVTQVWELLIQLAVVGLGAVLLQGVHDSTGGLLAPRHQTLLHRCQRPQSLHITTGQPIAGRRKKQQSAGLGGMTEASAPNSSPHLQELKGS